jgi:hypothetical protein
MTEGLSVSSCAGLFHCPRHGQDDSNDERNNKGTGMCIVSEMENLEVAVPSVILRRLFTAPLLCCALPWRRIDPLFLQHCNSLINATLLPLSRLHPCIIIIIYRFKELHNDLLTGPPCPRNGRRCSAHQLHQPAQRQLHSERSRSRSGSQEDCCVMSGHYCRSS